MMRRGQFRPAHAALTFGHGGRLPALAAITPGGARGALHGKIDRVDTIEGSGAAAVAVIDYKLGDARFSLARAYHGLSLQLLTYLLVLKSSGRDLAGMDLTPVAAFQIHLLRKLEDVSHPDEALSPQDPRFHLRHKPRGIFDGAFLPAFDSGADEGRSEVVAAFVKKDGTFGNRTTSDNADRRELDAMLSHVRRQIGKVADGILGGNIEVAPYRLNRRSPCVSCEFKDACRFDPAINQYRFLQSLGRNQVFVQLGEEGRADDQDD